MNVILSYLFISLKNIIFLESLEIEYLFVFMNIKIKTKTVMFYSRIVINLLPNNRILLAVNFSKFKCLTKAYKC